MQLKKKKIKNKKKECLKIGIDKSVDLYPNPFNSKNIILLKNMENYENKINCKDLSNKFLFTEEDIIRSHDIKFKKYMARFMTC